MNTNLNINAAQEETFDREAKVSQLQQMQKLASRPDETISMDLVLVQRGRQSEMRRNAVDERTAEKRKQAAADGRYDL